MVYLEFLIFIVKTKKTTKFEKKFAEVTYLQKDRNIYIYNKNVVLVHFNKWIRGFAIVHG